jgi:hypothetical protein
MVNQNKSLLLLVVGIVISMAFQSDDDPISDYIKRLKEYNQKYPQEKIHLHLDKPYYSAGDSIWLKAYTINTLSSGPSTISGVVYVDLINASDSIKTALRIPLVAGVSWGTIPLPLSLPEGNYRIRAYTQWMRNLGPDFFFDKTIRIGNTRIQKIITTTKFAYNQQKDAESVNAKIRFTNLQGSPFIQSELKYEVRLNAKTITKGKTKINEQGEASLSFVNDHPNTDQTGTIIASVSTADKKNVQVLIPITATSNQTAVQFFPESGNLIEGLPNKIGIKAINSGGLGEDISGTIVDNGGTEIIKFTTPHLGMGNFTLIPESGKSYTAKIKFSDGSTRTAALPGASKSGYILSAKQTKDAILLKVLASKSVMSNGTIKLIAQHNNNQYLLLKAGNSKDTISTTILKKDLPCGIIQLTLFSSDNIPVAERLIFSNTDQNKVKTRISLQKKVYGPKEAVDVELEATLKDKPTIASFSVAVTNMSAVTPDEQNESNIFSTLLLTSDLTGYVEKPNYYFINENEQTRQDLDNLMLTQGWRRLLWKNILNNTSPVLAFQPEKTLKISGTILKSKKPVANCKVSIINTSGELFKTDTLTDAQGRFDFDHLNLDDNSRIVIQASSEENKRNLEIKLDAVNGQVVTPNKNTGDLTVNVNESISKYLDQTESYFEQLAKRNPLQNGIQLKEVEITAQKKLVKNSSNLNGPGNADAVVAADQIQKYLTIAESLDGRVAGLTTKNGLPYFLRNGSNPMEFYLDGVRIDSNTFRQIRPMDIQAAEILKDLSKTTIYGSNAAYSGVLILTSKRPGDDNYAPRAAPGTLNTLYRGYTLSKEFYSPFYKPAGSVSIPDYRSTIYWNPNVITTAEGKAKISFFNADHKGTYRIVIEGMDMLGNLSHEVYSYEVK